MQDFSRVLCGAASAAVLLGALSLAPATPAMAEENRIAQGKQAALDRQKGNCLGCHQMDNQDQPGNIGPPLMAMKQRFPDREVLRAQIWDARGRNPRTIMPPFGAHGILTPEEVDLVTDYIHSL